MKACSACGEAKAPTDFHWKVQSRGLRMSACKECANARSVRWRAKHPERKKEHNRRYVAQHGAELNERKRQQRQEDPERFRAADRRYYASHRTEHYATMREWRRVNPARKIAHEQARRVGIEGLTDDDFEYIAVLYRDPCSYCGETAGTIDHIQPLSGGGSGGWENLTAACRRCNSTKRTTDVLRFLHRS